MRWVVEIPPCNAAYCFACAPTALRFCAAGSDKPVTYAALEFSMRPVNYGLYSVLALSCGFARDLPQDGTPAADAGTAWRFAIALWSNLPVDLPVASFEAWNLQPCNSLYLWIVPVNSEYQQGVHFLP